MSDATYTLFFEAGDAYEKYLQDEKEKSWYDTGIAADGDDQILVLVTCTADQKGTYDIANQTFYGPTRCTN